MAKFRPSSITIGKVEQFLIPSALLEDDNAVRVVRPLVALSVLGLVVAVVYAIVWGLMLPQDAVRIVPVFLTLFLASLTLFLIRLEKVRLARDILLVGSWVIVTIAMLTAGGTRAPIFGLYTMVVMVAALLSGWQLALFYATAAIVMAFIIAILDPAGTVLVPIATPMSAWLTQSAIMVMVTTAAYLILRQTHQALQRAQEALTGREKIQQALSENEERFRLIASVTSDYTFSTRVNEQGKWEHSLLTGAFEAITGYTPEEFLAIGGWQAILHPDHRAQDERDMAALQENRRVTSVVRIVKKGGEVRWVRVYAHPVWDEKENRLTAINGGVQDITERKLAEEALNESEKRYRVISEMISDYAYAYYVHPDGTFTPFWITEDSFQRMTGYTWDEIGATYSLYHPEDAETAHQHVSQTIGGQPISGEYRIVTKNGEIRWLRIQRELEWDEHNHRPIRVYGAAQDITEHKRFEAELREYANQLERLVDERTNALRRTKEQLELVLNNTANALAFADPSGDILVTNPAYRAVFAERGSESIEFVLWSLASEEQMALVSDALLKAIYDNERQRVETQIVSEASRTIDIDLTLIPVSITENNPRTGVLLSGHDITQLKEIERFKARFVADAVHDLATPIAGLSTRLYLLKRDPERLAHHIDALENQVRHLRNLLDDLRTLSKMDRGQLALSMALCNVNELVQRVFDTYEPVAISKQQTLQLKITPTLPNVYLDPKQIERVLLNLISNAVNYTPEHKGISIETTLEEQAVVITVADQGTGISADDLPHVFERFYRSVEARQSLSSGTGLGLAITKEIVEMHGGSVTVTSEPGQGSTFTVRLPLHA